MIVVTQCERPPIEASCQGGPWWFYQVATVSGRNHATGYAPGTKAEAHTVASRALAALRRMEGERAAPGWSGSPFTAGIAGTTRRTKHNLEFCDCKRCGEERLQRAFSASIADARS